MIKIFVTGHLRDSCDIKDHLISASMELKYYQNITQANLKEFNPDIIFISNVSGVPKHIEKEEFKVLEEFIKYKKISMIITYGVYIEYEVNGKIQSYNNKEILKYAGINENCRYSVKWISVPNIYVAQGEFKESIMFKNIGGVFHSTGYAKTQFPVNTSFLTVLHKSTKIIALGPNTIITYCNKIIPTIYVSSMIEYTCNIADIKFIINMFKFLYNQQKTISLNLLCLNKILQNKDKYDISVLPIDLQNALK